VKARSPIWYFAFFFVSGFCSLLYEIIWLRLAMSQFGVTTAMVSIVLAAFMGGLGLGSWFSGHISGRYGNQVGVHPLVLYASTELLIGISGLVVPYELFSGGHLLRQAVLSFAGHYALAGVWVSLSLVPWCACMGATFPFAMLAIKSSVATGKEHSFSYLYLANLLGAIAGTIVPLLLIEMFGFRRTLYAGTTLNFLLALSAVALAMRTGRASNVEIQSESKKQTVREKTNPNTTLMWLLFGTGLTSMGAEVVWTRLYTPSVGTLVYAFAAILALYLAATYFGSWYYRRHRNVPLPQGGLTWLLLGFTVLFPLVSVDPRLTMPAILRVLLGIAPMSGLVGFVTPKIVDLYSKGDPDLAGEAYAVNIVGCVLGPLLAGFLLLPLVGERWALCLLSLPWFLTGLSSQWQYKRSIRILETAVGCVLVLGATAILFFSEAFEDQFHPRRVLRDSTATVVATGSGFARRLLVNGVGITSLTPITKIMAHLPLALLSHRPLSALIICFGMGTSHRSALSWHINSTAVELVPSVPALFPYFHPNGPVGLDSPLSRIVIDDGRSYLERTREQFDVIVIDPPPPMGAAASSLLYSKEFYAIAKQRLHPGGIVQQWLPGDDGMTKTSVVRAISESFPYVRAFVSVEHTGLHLLASTDPIPYSTASELAQRLPADAARDLTEWGPAATPEAQFQLVLGQEVSVDKLLEDGPRAPALQDDRPVNEFFLIRKVSQPGYWREALKRATGSKKLF
jgi:spermidine synthase